MFATPAEHRPGNARLGSRAARQAAVLAGAAVLLCACGGGGEDSSGTPTPGNHAPTISGAPAGVVMQGQAYAFTPTASDADGNSLTFSITNKPSWATFSAATGALTGTPGAGDVATYANIQISVSDGTDSANLGAFNVQVTATASGSVMLTWQPPTQNTDGSALANLAGYKIYWGKTQGNYTNSVTVSNPGLTSYVVDQLTTGTWFFTATAMNAQSIESDFSNVVSKAVQ
jgi:hypothetical protein